MAYNPMIDGITNSLLTSFRECPTKCRMKINGWRSSKTSESLIYGSVFHSYKEVCLTQLKEKLIKPSDLSSEEFMNTVTPLVMAEYEDEYKNAKPEIVESWFITFRVMSTIMIEYFKAWQYDFIGNSVKSLVEVEKEFYVKLGEVFLRGKRDAVYEARKRPWLLENKTMARLFEDSLTKTISRYSQVLVYILAYYLETGVQLKGVLYNIIKKSSLRKGAKEDLNTHINRVCQDIADRPEFYFVRFETPIPWEHVEIFRDRLEKELNQFQIWVGSNPKLDYQYTHTCRGNYGSCEYINYCDSGKQCYDGLTQFDNLFPELKNPVSSFIKPIAKSKFILKKKGA